MDSDSNPGSRRLDLANASSLLASNATPGQLSFHYSLLSRLRHMEVDIRCPQLHTFIATFEKFQT